MADKRRKPGDWKTVAAAHAAVPRILEPGHGLTNIPKIIDIGSAAYRRILAKKGRQVWASPSK